MAFDIVFYVLQYLTFDGLASTAILFLIAFVLWEAPRFFKILDDDVTKGLYPGYGKAVDIAALVIGLGSFVFLLFNMYKLAPLALSHDYGLLLAGGLLGLPVVLLLAYFGRLFNRMDAKHEPQVFILHMVLDLVHTIFYILLLGLLVPAAVLIFSSTML
jgi:hypothetical protein